MAERIATLVRRRRSLVPYFRLDGGSDVAGLDGTFSRASTATFVDANGVVQTAASGVCRTAHYVGGVGPLVLLEGSRQNILLWSQGFATAPWGVFNAAVDVDAGVAPDGTTTADRHTATAAASQVFQSWTGTAAVYTTSVFVKRDGANTTFTLEQVTSGRAAGASCVFTLTGAGSAGTVTHYGASSGYTAGIERLGATDWYRVWLSGLASATTWFFASTLPNTGESVLLWGAQTELGAFPSSYIPTTSAAVTRAADALSFPFLMPPQAMTVYVDEYDLGSAQSGHWLFGIAGTTNPSLAADATSSRPRLIHHNGTTSVSSQPANTVAFGNRVEFRGVLNADGSVLAGSSINGASEVLGSASSALTPAAAWSATTLGVAQFGTTGSFAGFIAFRRVLVLPGVRSLAECRMVV